MNNFTLQRNAIQCSVVTPKWDDPKERDICIHIDSSLFCTVETNATL